MAEIRISKVLARKTAISAKLWPKRVYSMLFRYFLVEVVMLVIFLPMHLIEVIPMLVLEKILQMTCSMLKWNRDEWLHLYL